MNQLRPLVSPLLVGRDDLLALAERRLAEVAAGHTRLLLLAGEAGIGKTRLLNSVLRKADAAGFRAAKGDLAPADRQVPLASVLDLARTMQAYGGFGALGDELLAIRGGAGGDSLGSRRLLVRDVAALIRNAIDRPTVLAFEDLQWADELSLEVVGELARVGGDRPLLVLGAYRADELPPDSVHREWRARILAQRLGEEARLAPLSYEETALVTSLILGTGLPAPREVVAAVYRRTDGIPLHIEELLGALDDKATASGQAIRDAQVPDTIEDAVLARVSRLSDEARAAARAGAVIGRCFEPQVLAGVMDRPVADLDAPLAELAAHGILYPFEFIDRGYFDFRHQLLRDALYRSVPAADLRRLHARAGEFGAQLVGATEVHSSVHFERAGLRSQAYRAALAGARAASAISSRRESFELYARAVANVPDDLPPEELAALWDGYTEAAFAIDDVEVGTRAATEARRHHLRAGDVIGAALALLGLAGMLRRDAQPIYERRRLLAQAVEELIALPESRERALALADVRDYQAVTELDSGRIDEAMALLDEVRRLRGEAGDSDPSDDDFMDGWRRVIGGDVDAGLGALLRVAHDARDRHHEGTGVTAYRVAGALAAREMRYEIADATLREGLLYADEIEQSYCRHVMAATSAQVAWAIGRWDEAIPVAELEMVERGSRRGTAGSRDALGYVLFGRGEVDRAREVLEASLAIGRASGEASLMLPPLWGLAEAALVADEPDVALDHCETALALVADGGDADLLVPFVVTGTRAALALNRPDAAERWHGRAAEQLEAWASLASPALDHADGLLRLAAGSTVAARTLLESAVVAWEARSRTWEAAWARLDLARCMLRAGRPADAMPHLAAVLEVGERLRSGPLQVRAEELVALARSRSVPEEAWWPLSAREFEVAGLVTEGMTNAAIAEELGLSPKTVSAHVEHILAKLGLTRRAEIAAWAVGVKAASSARTSAPMTAQPAAAAPASSAHSGARR